MSHEYSTGGTDDMETPEAAQEGASELKARLAAKIARAIFAVGDEPLAFGGKAQRIQFMGGRWPDAEKAMGGFSEDALALYIEEVLAANDGGERR